MSKPLSVLMVEDSENDAELLQIELRRQGLAPTVMRVDTGPALRAALLGRAWDVVISDHNMPSFSGDEALKIVKQYAPDVPFIVVSGTRSEEEAVEAMRAGASDFIVKTRLHRLAPVIERELQDSALRAEQRRMANALAESQQQLRQAQKLEAVGRLAGGVAHDFNNLLGAILAYADLVLKDLPDEHAHRGDVEEIKRASARAAELTRQLLAFSRQQVLHRTVLNLNRVIDEVLPLLRRLVGPQVTIDVRPHRRLWNVKADPMQIEQILMNLAVNARDAMPHGGTFTIRTSNVAVSGVHRMHVPQVPGHYVRIEVRDSGEGIAADVLPKIFEPFFTTKEEGKGTGLGLATVYGIVQQSGGCIFVDSRIGQGTTFTIFLPRTTEGRGASPSDNAGRTAEDAGARILLVEDEAAVRELSVRALSDAGFTVVAPAAPERALAEAADAPVDVLVTDLCMRGLTGYALAQQLRASRPNLRVLFMTSPADAVAGPLEIAEHEDLLVKPFAPPDLVAKVRETLSLEMTWGIKFPGGPRKICTT
jgi:signal transduction histidine kinase